MARMIGASHYWNSWGCGWRDGYPSPHWPKYVQVAFKRRERRREHQRWLREVDR